MVVVGGIYLQNRIFREARRNPKALNVTLEDKSAEGNN
jgi:hypothetical protein